MKSDIDAKLSQSSAKLTKNYTEAKKFYGEVLAFSNKVIPAMKEVIKYQQEHAAMLKRDIDILERQTFPDDAASKKDLEKIRTKFDSVYEQSTRATKDISQILDELISKINSPEVAKALKSEKIQVPKEETGGFFRNLFG